MRFRLTNLIAEARDREGSFSALAKAIGRANPRVGGGDWDADPIERRKLKAFVEGDERVSYSIRDLRFLDGYLEQFRQGLARVPIFTRDDLVGAIAQTGAVTFLLGTRPDGFRYVMNHFDALGASYAQSAINVVPTPPRFEIRDAPLEELGPGVRSAPWFRSFDPGRKTLITLGSSVVSPATEIMMRLLFQRAVEPGDEDCEIALPFQFIWNRPHSIESKFETTADAIRDQHPEKAREIEENRVSALVIGDEVLIDEHSRIADGGEDAGGHTYGVILAQRRGQAIWTALVGITGVASLVAAKQLPRINVPLAPEGAEKDSPVYWAVIRATVPTSPPARVATMRDFEDETIHILPRAWPPPVESESPGQRPIG
jgi:hypothetical protein